MTYFEFMLAFCGENRIDKTDFEKTMQDLMDRNGIHASLYEYFDKTVTDNLSLIMTDTVTIQKKEYERYMQLKRLRLHAAEQFDSINNFATELLILLEALANDSYNTDNILRCIFKTITQLNEHCIEYEKLINS